MTTATNITTAQIRTLRSEAEQAGDLRMAMICVLAIGGTDALDGADAGTEADILLTEGRTQDWARTQCARAISAAQAHA